MEIPFGRCETRKEKEGEVLDKGNLEAWSPWVGREEMRASETLLCPARHSGHQPAAAACAVDADSAAGRAQGEAAQEEAPPGSLQRPPGSSKA